MINDDSRQGWFAVKIDVSGQRPSVYLTGRHFGRDEIDEAKSYAGAETKASVSTGGSPVYLIRDSIVGLASEILTRPVSSSLSECRSGRFGRPCGRCWRCMEARLDAFSRIVMAGMDLPGGDLARRVSGALMSVTGMAWADAPWMGSMSEEDVENVLDDFNETKERAKR